MRFMCWVKAHWLFSFLIAMVVFGVLCIFAINIAAAIHEKKENRLQLEAFNELISDKAQTTAFSYLLTRKSVYYKTYFRWQSLGKIFGILSVFLSIGTLVLSYELREQCKTSWQSTIISLLATGFVVFSLYMKPDKKSREYVKAWRECNSLVNNILYSKTSFYYVSLALKNIENELPSDED